MQALLFDMDGVLYNSEEPIPGAAETLAWVRNNKIPHLFVTNTTSRSRDALAAKLARFGIPASSSEIIDARWVNHYEIQGGQNAVAKTLLDREITAPVAVSVWLGKDDGLPYRIRYGLTANTQDTKYLVVLRLYNYNMPMHITLP